MIPVGVNKDGQNIVAKMLVNIVESLTAIVKINIESTIHPISNKIIPKL